MTHGSSRDGSSPPNDAQTSETGKLAGFVAVATDRQETICTMLGGRRAFGGPAMTSDTVFAIFSATKALTAAVCLQLVERGELDLDAPASRYLPKIAGVQVLEGFEQNGTPRLRAPRSEITTRMLLLHTAGFPYPFFNEDARRFMEVRGFDWHANSAEVLKLPLLFDPGTNWEYGASSDWAGQVVEAITTRRLGHVMAENLFEPLEMRDTAFVPTQDMLSRLATLYARTPDGGLAPIVGSLPEIDMGGHGLLSTVDDFVKFIRMWLNDGRGPSGPVLRRETIEMASKSGLTDQVVKPCPGVVPAYSNDVEFFPGLKKSWGMTFMVNEEVAPTGRSAGSLAWAGLGNLYFWIDRTVGVGGFWATQVLPFMDAVSYEAYLAFETSIYQTLKPGSPVGR